MRNCRHWAPLRLFEAARVVEYPLSNRALTGLAAGPDGALYIAQFAANRILRLTLDGQGIQALANLAVPIDVAFDPAGRLYVLEYHAGSRELGRVLRVSMTMPPRQEVLASSLAHPTAMAFGPDGGLYISTRGSANTRHGRYRGPAAQGQIQRLRLPPAPG